MASSDGARLEATSISTSSFVLIVLLAFSVGIILGLIVGDHAGIGTGRFQQRCNDRGGIVAEDGNCIAPRPPIQYIDAGAN